MGDSILQALEHTEVWNQWFSPLHCLNFSIHKDQTQNVLWRIKNGELDHVDPKVCFNKHLVYYYLYFINKDQKIDVALYKTSVLF